MGLAIAFFHPGRDQPHGDAAGVRLGCIECVEQGEPFEIAPGGIDDLDLPGICCVDDVLCAGPETAHIFGVVDHGVRGIVASTGNIEAGVEHASLTMRRTPARERHEHVEVERQVRFGKQRAKWFARVKPGLGGCNPVGGRVGAKADRDAAFLKRFADCGNPGGTFIGFMCMRCRNGMVVGIDPPPWEDDRSTGKGHAGRAFDHQQFGWSRDAVPEDDERSRRDRDRPFAVFSCIVVIHPESPILDRVFGKGAKMGIVEILGVAGSVSLLAGWRLYLCIFATGLAMRLGWIAPPEHLQSLAVLANNWVMGAASLGMVAEFLADKVAWLDSLWDAVHTAIRPVGGALLALALVDASDPKWQVITLLLGGGAALASHGAKAGTRAVINASPEPFSNIAVSTGEDVATGGLLFLALSNPTAAIFVAILMAAVAIATLVMVRRVLKKLFGVAQGPPATE